MSTTTTTTTWTTRASSALGFALLAASAPAAEIDFAVDPTRSSLTVELLGVDDSSAISGGGTIELIPPAEPFNTAQFTDFLYHLDDGFQLSLIAGLVQVIADPGAVTLQLLEPGDPGYLEGGEFAQLGNLVELSGLVEVVDPLGLFIGSQVVDLGSYGPVVLDISTAYVEVVGDAMTVTTVVNTELEVSPGVTLFVDGSIVAHGTIPPCAEDLDGDGSIGVGDLLAVLGGWGTGAGDVTGDGTTDVADLLAVLSAWGPC